ncbi:hypothetical protein Y032_0002g652 [Ancylostoma ceylanicum]|uniref:Ig-like domain-containing protein n=1 Tax=Ancylostoma ceylanicum TaxID=53326 RepID=A0A016W0S8_9BILA|nr:hypothetical protein Y032_0002g652 [Ancylostoma ceylanicum]
MIPPGAVDALLGVLLLIRCSFEALPKTPEWESDNVHFVPPPDWESKNMPRPIKQYMEYEWSLSTYTNECGEGNPLKIVPVYFWPGDQVDLPCLMCELAFVFNGKMKMWGKATNILKFLENPKRTARFSSKYWSRISNNEKLFAFSSKNATEKEIVDWMPAVTDKNGISVNLPKKEPVYIQRNGKLSIIRASPASQGVYFCYDGQSRAYTSIFYVVMAMTPPVRMSEMANVLADGCFEEVEDHLIRPNFNWRYHFVPNVRHEAPQECLLSKENEFCNADYVRS